MRIDRRGNPAFRKFPVAEELKGNIDLTGNVLPGPASPDCPAGQEGELARDRPSTPFDAFEVLGNGGSGFLKGAANVFAAVRQALKDIKQGNSKTFD